MQFHPEARGGPHDTAFLFRDFIQMVRGAAPQRVLIDPTLYDAPRIRKVLLIGSGGLSIGQGRLTISPLLYLWYTSILTHSLTNMHHTAY